MLQAKVSVWEEDIDRVSPRPIAEKREANSWKLSGRFSIILRNRLILDGEKSTSEEEEEKDEDGVSDDDDDSNGRKTCLFTSLLHLSDPKSSKKYIF